MRTTDIFSLDFTAGGALDDAETLGSIQATVEQAQSMIGALERAVARGSQDSTAWRLLACLHLGTGDIQAFNAVDARHEEQFGYPIFLFSKQPKPERDPQRRQIDIPAKVERGTLPVKEILAGCDSEEGAALDFSRVKSADLYGLAELLGLLERLPRDERRPETPGLERFIESLEKASASRNGSEIMWHVILEYRRWTGDRIGFQRLAEQFLQRYGRNPKPFA